MPNEKAWLVAGLGFGDEGKGAIVDYLTRLGAGIVVRYNGGAQAAHRVALEDGRDHIFAQFGSGTLVPGVLTHLSRFMLVEPSGMLNEYKHLKKIGLEDAFARTSIDESAPLITPFHVSANRLLELERAGNRHGSCGLGIGEAMEDIKNLGDGALKVGDLRDASEFYKKLLAVRDRKKEKVRRLFDRFRYMHSNTAMNVKVFESNDVLDWWMNRYAEFIKMANIVKDDYLARALNGRVSVFEGAQGMLLHPDYGFYPHVTKTDISYKNAVTLLDEAVHTGERIKVGVLRGYMTRHGAGPFATEDKTLSKDLQDDCGNRENDWQGRMRVGYFDMVAAKYAIDAIGGVDELAITNLDRLFEAPELKVAIKYFNPDMSRDNDNLGLYNWDGRFINGIKKPVNPTRIYQEALTKSLESVSPVYEGVDAISDEKDGILYAIKIAEGLGVKLMVASFGPTAGDKTSNFKP